MAIISKSTYTPPIWSFNGHFDTIFPALFRQVKLDKTPKEIALSTLDNDSFDIDYYDNSSNKTIILSHGLEGHSKRPYILGMVKKFHQKGWNVIAWNYRGCNGKMNNSIKSYHSGFTQDLKVVINFADRPDVDHISLIGFSLGGNLSLRYLGADQEVNLKITSAVVLSVPLDLHYSSLQIGKKSNFFYSKRFLRTLKKKVREKAILFQELDVSHLHKIKDLKTFDDHFTAPMHGYKDALDYYESCSALFILNEIKVPTLIINAINDPFLPKECYPFAILEKSSIVHLETPKNGGHVGFYAKNGNGFYWSENRAYQFIESTL